MYFYTINLKSIDTTSSQNSNLSSSSSLIRLYIEYNIIEIEVRITLSVQVLCNHAIGRVATAETWVARRLRNIDIWLARLEACCIDIIFYAEARFLNNKLPGVVSAAAVAVISLCKMCLCRNI